MFVYVKQPNHEPEVKVRVFKNPNNAAKFMKNVTWVGAFNRDYQDGRNPRVSVHYTKESKLTIEQIAERFKYIKL